MNSLLRNMMAQMESWEAANEFGIPEKHWRNYQVQKRSDDLYVACLSAIFDALRLKDDEEKHRELDALARTLVIYSRSAAAKHLTGVERTLNQLYSAALFYLADRPATACFLTRRLVIAGEVNEEEEFLRSFLAHDLIDFNSLAYSLEDYMKGRIDSLDDLRKKISAKRKEGLESDPRQFIAAAMAEQALRRFAKVNVWEMLKAFASVTDPKIWQPFLFNNSSFSIWELLPSQVTALESGVMDSDVKAVSLQMPTSAGKTSLCELLIFHEVVCLKRRVLFLVPFRALAAEISAGMSPRLEAAGVTVMASYGGNLPTKSETTSVETADALIVTPEKFSALSQVLPDLPNQFLTIVCDEGHLIDDESRGLAYELLLTKLKSLEGDSRKIVFMSAILPNVADIHAWLGGTDDTMARSDYKPVDSDYAFLVQDNKNSWKLDVNPLYPRPKSYFLSDFLVQDDFRFTNLETERRNLIDGWNSPSSLACGAALKARRNGSVALFTTTRGKNGISGLCSKFLKLCENETDVAKGSPELTENNEKIREYLAFLLGEEFELTRLIGHGIGYHHGKLPQEIRRCMEESLGDGDISILICTSTLAEGVNLPIRTLVVHTFSRFNEAKGYAEPLEKRSIKNIIGRVGRAGKETLGRAVCINPGDRELVIQVLKNKGLEPAKGRLYRLIAAIENYSSTNQVEITNELLNAAPKLADFLEDIDHAVVDLAPLDEEGVDLETALAELLDRTLAYHQGGTEEFKQMLKTVFTLRGENFEATVPRDSWALLKSSGTTPKLWQRIQHAGLHEYEMWLTLKDPFDKQWLEYVIKVAVGMLDLGDDLTLENSLKVIEGWMSGETYSEIAEMTSLEVGVILEAVCSLIGFDLQDLMSKLSQVAIAWNEAEEISELAQAWPSLLQYGISTLQQLDLFELGASDRMAVWGIQRFLDHNKVSLRGRDLLSYLRRHAGVVQTVLFGDARIPTICAERTVRELKLDDAGS